MFMRDCLDPAWAALSRLLDDGLELPEAVRCRWLEKLPAEHDALRPRLRRLLCESSGAINTTFLRIPDDWHSLKRSETAEQQT
jgi:hypothetical protein